CVTVVSQKADSTAFALALVAKIATKRRKNLVIVFITFFLRFILLIFEFKKHIVCVVLTKAKIDCILRDSKKNATHKYDFEFYLLRKNSN
ncbi:hypothetical protein JZU68_00995, partial [bacterium]|nr:hypothetical protein [bacterium]